MNSRSCLGRNSEGVDKISKRGKIGSLANSVDIHFPRGEENNNFFLRDNASPDPTPWP